MNRYKYLDGYKKAQYYIGQILKLRKPMEERIDRIKVLGPAKHGGWNVIAADNEDGAAYPGRSSEKSLKAEYEPI